jgi:hypothetical protein
MSETYYIKKGRKYVVAEETPRFLSDGVWLVDHKTTKKQYIAKVGELRDNVSYGQLVKDTESISSFIRAKVSEYFGETFKLQPDGNFRYALPSATDMAYDILKFISMSKEDRGDAIRASILKSKHIDKDGNVVDDNYNIVYQKHSKEAVAFEISELKKRIDTLEILLGEKCVEDL